MADTPISRLREAITSKDYQKYRTALQELNSKVPNQSKNVSFDQTNESPFSVARKSFEKTLEKQFFEREEHLGICLRVDTIKDGAYLDYKIYVDVPGLEIENIGHQDGDKAKILINNNEVEHKAFYPVTQENTIEIPQKGDIVRVRVAKNYFNTSNFNPRDNVYLGIFSKGVAPSTDPDIQLKRIADALDKKEYRSQFRDKFSPSELTKVDNLDILTPPWNGNLSDYAVISPVGRRANPTEGASLDHAGLDFQLTKGIEIIAPHDMIIRSVSTKVIDPRGLFVEADSVGFDGKPDKKWKYKFFHLSEVYVPATNTGTATKLPDDRVITPVKRGQIIKRGEPIGRSGNTSSFNTAERPEVIGYHLHFEIRELRTNSRINPLLFFTGDISLTKEMELFTGWKSPISLPLPEESPEPISFVPPNEAPPTFRAQQTPVVEERAAPASAPASRPKLLLLSLETDLIENINSVRLRGAKQIKVREDIIPDLLKIKNILNSFKIPFSCNAYDIKLTNNELSFLAKVGLEIKLNPSGGFSEINDLETDAYFVGPDKTKPYSSGFKNIVYGNVKTGITYTNIDYKPEKKIIEVYDGRETGRLETKKILKNVLNITKIFEDNGFIAKNPEKDFFKTRIPEKSNWFLFEKPSKINIGYSYKQLLETVYTNNNEPIWRLPDLKWDGSRFI